jgi:hypothetical protein
MGDLYSFPLEALPGPLKIPLKMAFGGIDSDLMEDSYGHKSCLFVLRGYDLPP